MMAAFRQPKKASVTGFPSDVMNRAETGSASICVFGSISASCHRRNIRRSVAITGAFVCGIATLGLTRATMTLSYSRRYYTAIPVGVGQSTIHGDIVIT